MKRAAETLAVASPGQAGLFELGLAIGGGGVHLPGYGYPGVDLVKTYLESTRSSRYGYCKHTRTRVSDIALK